MDSRRRRVSTEFHSAFHVKVSARCGALRAAARATAVDYGAFLLGNRQHILSFSPELFLRIENDGLTAHRHAPMKGTARRGALRARREIAEWLRNDPKNRSEM